MNYVAENLYMPAEFYQKFPVVWNGNIEMQGLPARLELHHIWGSIEAADRGLKYEADDMAVDDEITSEPENGDRNNENDETTLDPRNSCIMLALPYGKNFAERLFNILKSQIIMYYIRSNTLGEEPSLTNEERPHPITCNITMEELERVINSIYSEENDSVEYATEQRNFSTHLYVPSVKTEGMLSMCAPELLELLRNKCYFMVLVKKRLSTIVYEDKTEEIENIDPNIIQGV